MEHPDIPAEVIFTILTHLPAKSALRFRALSKSWNVIITSPCFTRHHHSLALRRRNPTTFITSVSSYTVFSGALKWITIDKIVVNSAPINLPDANNQYLVGETSKIITGDPCSGVVCVVRGSNAALWNPATREARTVEFDSGWQICIGFGSLKDVEGNVVDFKLLFWSSSYEETGNYYEIYYEVYSLRTDSWTFASDPSFPIDFRHLLYNNGRYLNSVIHWLMKVENQAPYILTFDFVSETFGQIDLPFTKGVDIRIRDMNFLRVADDQYLQFGMFDWKAGCFLNLWELRKNGGQISWVRRERLVVSTVKLRNVLTLKYFDCIGGVISLSDDGKCCVRVKGMTGEHNIGIGGFHEWYHYTESLVWLKGIADHQYDFQP